LCSFPRQFQGIAENVCVFKDFVALIMMTKHDTAFAEFGFGGNDAGVAFGIINQGVIMDG
jgi:hypothetical protein